MVKSRYWISCLAKTTDEGPIMFGVSANIDATGIAAAFADDPQASVDDISRSMKQFLMPLGMIGKDETVIPLGTNSGRQSWIPFDDPGTCL